MLRKHRYKFILCLTWFFIALFFSIEPNVWLQLALMIFILVMIGVFIESISGAYRNFKEDRALAFLPLLVCILAIPGPFIIGGKVKAYVFEYRLPQYMEIVNRIQESDINYRKKLTAVSLENDEAHLAYMVFAIIEDDVLYVEFLTGGGFPVKHSGYIYSQSQNVKEGTQIDERWPKYKRWKVNDNWFGFSG